MVNTTQVVPILIFAFENRRGRLAGLVSTIQDLIRDYPATRSWRAALAYVYADGGRRGEARPGVDRLAAQAGFGMTEELTWVVVNALLAETRAPAGEPAR